MKTDLSKVDVRLAVVDEPPYKGEPIFIPCTEHRDQGRPNCAVYPEHIHCYVCSFHIKSRMESLAYLLNIPLHEAFRRARFYTSEHLEAYRERAALQPRLDALPTGLASGYHALLREARTKRAPWYHDRGIPDAWINRMLLGHTGEKFSIPIWDKQHNLINIRFRRDEEYVVEDDETPKYSGMRGRNGTYFYPEPLFNTWASSQKSGGDWCVVCEGELDALRLWVEDIPTISPTNGANSVKHVVEYLKQYPNIRRVYLATDQDAAGDKAAEEFINASSTQFDIVERLVWSEAKDVTELYQRGGYLTSAFSVDLEGVEYVGSDGA